MNNKFVFATEKNTLWNILREKKSFSLDFDSPKNGVLMLGHPKEDINDFMIGYTRYLLDSQYNIIYIKDDLDKLSPLDEFNPDTVVSIEAAMSFNNNIQGLFVIESPRVAWDAEDLISKKIPHLISHLSKFANEKTILIYDVCECRQTIDSESFNDAIEEFKCQSGGFIMNCISSYRVRDLKKQFEHILIGLMFDPNEIYILGLRDAINSQKICIRDLSSTPEGLFRYYQSSKNKFVISRFLGLYGIYGKNQPTGRVYHDI